MPESEPGAPGSPELDDVLAELEVLLAAGRGRPYSVVEERPSGTVLLRVQGEERKQVFPPVERPPGRQSPRVVRVDRRLLVGLGLLVLLKLGQVLLVGSEGPP